MSSSSGGAVALSSSRSSQHCTLVEYVLYPIPPDVSSSVGPGGGGWVRSIAKARSLADISSPFGYVVFCVVRWCFWYCDLDRGGGGR